MKNLHTMSVPELSVAQRDLGVLVREIADTCPEAARLVTDLMGLVAQELHARAFGGGAEARAHAARHHRERTGH